MEGNKVAVGVPTQETNNNEGSNQQEAAKKSSSSRRSTRDYSKSPRRSTTHHNSSKSPVRTSTSRDKSRDEKAKERSRRSTRDGPSKPGAHHASSSSNNVSRSKSREHGDRKAKDRARRSSTDAPSKPGAHSSSVRDSKRERNKQRDADNNAKDREKRHRHQSSKVVGAVSVADNVNSDTRERRKAERANTVSPNRSSTRRGKQDADVKSKRRNRASEKPSKPGAVPSMGRDKDIRVKKGTDVDINVQEGNTDENGEVLAEAMIVNDEDNEEDKPVVAQPQTTQTQNEIELERRLREAEERLEQQRQEMLEQQQQTKPFWKSPIFICLVILLLIGGGVGAYFGLAAGGSEEVPPATPNDVDTETKFPTVLTIPESSPSPSDVPASESPSTSPPTNKPVYDPPNAEDCTAMALGENIGEDLSLLNLKKLKLTMNLVLQTTNTDDRDESLMEEELGLDLQESLQKVLIPTIAGCPSSSDDDTTTTTLQGRSLIIGNNTKKTPSLRRHLQQQGLDPYVVATGFVRADVKIDSTCPDDEDATCDLAFVDIDLYLRASEIQFFNLIQLVLQVLDEEKDGGIVGILGVDTPPFEKITIVESGAGEDTAPPSSQPSEVPSEQPSLEPTSSVSASAPVTFPTPPPTVAPTVGTSQTPTANPSTTPSGTPSTPNPTTPPNPDPTPPPSHSPTRLPSEAPSSTPSLTPSVAPSLVPSAKPSSLPSKAPSVAPSTAPSLRPSMVASDYPSSSPSAFDRAAAVTAILTSNGYSLTSAAATWIINTDTWYPSSEDAETLILDRFALAALYYGTSGNNWKTKTNWLSNTISVCSWFGVTCDGSRVSELNLERNRMNGDIPVEFAALGHIKVLRFLQGTIPSKIFPSAICDLTSLTLLRFIGMGLNNNPLPSEIGNLINIEHLNINGGKYTSFPAELFSLPKVTFINLAGSALTPGDATIPTEFGLLNGLTELIIHSSQLTGTIPAEIANLVNLSYFHISTNSLTGLGSGVQTLSNLKTLLLAKNPLGPGGFPSELLEMGKLETIGAADCGLTGPLPTDIGSKMSSLKNLDIHTNSFTGDIPVLPPLLTNCNLKNTNFGDKTNGINSNCKFT